MSAVATATVIDIEDARFAPVMGEKSGRTATIRIAIPPGPEHYWPAILSLAKTGHFTAGDVAHAVGGGLAPAEAYMAKLRAGGFITAAGVTTDRRTLYAIASRRALPPQVDGRGNESHTYTVTERIWRAIRMMKSFTVTTLTAHLHDPKEPIGRDTVTTYVNALAEAGYLDQEGAERPLGERRHHFKRHMDGRLPPRLMRASLVYDPNRNAVAGHTIRAEEVRL